MLGRLRMLLATTLVSLAVPALAGDAVNFEMWLRRPGNATKTNIKGNLISLDLKGLTLDDLTTYDIQYERDVRVRGMHLRDLLTIFKPIPEYVDMILLHTKNGMIIPVSIGRLRKDIQVFIALEIQQDGKWTTAFPQTVRINPNDTATIPTVFGGNKIVVGKDWRATDTGFTPWRYLDTLTGVEFVESSAYYEQFRDATTEKAALRGRWAYMIHCQYCHGVSGIGASRAPDLAKVVGVDGKDAWEKLYKQVQTPADKDKGMHFMPAQSDFTKTNAKEMIRWLRTMRRGSASAYEPSYQATVKWRD